MTELKTCPFCGGAADVTHVSDFRITSPRTGRRVNCGQCSAQTGAFATEGEAIEAWDCRTDPSDALRKAEKALAFALEVVCSYEEGGECSESGEFIKTDLADVRAALGVSAVDSEPKKQ